MISRSISIAMLLLATLPAVASAQEQAGERWSDKGGRFGVGAATTFGAAVVDAQLDFGLGVSGVSLRYNFSHDFGLHLQVGFGYSNDGGGAEQFDFGTGLYGDYRLVPFDVGKLGLLFGLDFSYYDGTPPVFGTDGDGFDFGAVVGLIFELWPAEALSLFVSGGLRFIYYDRNVAGGGGVDGVLFTLGTALWGTAGFTVWF